MRKFDLVRSVRNFALGFGVSWSVLIFMACGSSKGSNDEQAQDVPVMPQPGESGKPGLAKIEWSSVEPVIASNCAGSSCHGQGSRLTVFVGNQANFDRSKTGVIALVGSGAMPPIGKMPDKEKEVLLQYARQ